MHPIEWLRLVARSDYEVADEFAAEAAQALAGLGNDPRGIVPACRRLLERHPDVGPLWWVCARMLSTADPRGEAIQIEADLAAEQTGLQLALDLPERPDGSVRVAFAGWTPLVDEITGRRPDVTPVLVENGKVDTDALAECVVLLLDVVAAGAELLLAPPPGLVAVDAARATGLEVWAVVGVGRRLPEPLFRAMRARATSLDAVPSALAGRAVEPVRIGCPAPPELLHLT